MLLKKLTTVKTSYPVSKLKKQAEQSS